MKVLVIVPDVGRYGGTNRFLERLLVIHSRREIATTLLVPTDQCNSELVALVEHYDIELVKAQNQIRPNTAPFLTPFFDFLFVWRTVLNRRPDLIVVSTGEPGRLSILFYFPVPVLYILHSIPEQHFRFLPRVYLWFGSLLGNCVMSVSNAAAISVSALMGIPRSRVKTVYNSCGVEKYKNVSDMSIILTAGHLVTYKNPELWLETALRVLMERPETQFVWLGDGELFEAINDKVKKMSLEKQIILPGYESDPSKWYAQAHIYFQPSLRENHSIAVLEAMSYGLPCVVANTGGLPESVIDGETGYVCSPCDPAAYAARIIELISDTDLRERMGIAGRQRVEKCFSEDIQERGIMAIYDQLTR